MLELWPPPRWGLRWGTDSGLSLSPCASWCPGTGGDRPLAVQGVLRRGLCTCIPSAVCTHVPGGVCIVASVGFSLQAPSPRVGAGGEAGGRGMPPGCAAEWGSAARVRPTSRGRSSARCQPGPGHLPHVSAGQGMGEAAPAVWVALPAPPAPAPPPPQRDPEQQNNHFQHHYPLQTSASNFNQRSWCCFKICGF